MTPSLSAKYVRLLSSGIVVFGSIVGVASAFLPWTKIGPQIGIGYVLPGFFFVSLVITLITLFIKDPRRRLMIFASSFSLCIFILAPFHGGAFTHPWHGLYLGAYLALVPVPLCVASILLLTLIEAPDAFAVRPEKKAMVTTLVLLTVVGCLSIFLPWGEYYGEPIIMRPYFPPSYIISVLVQGFTCYRPSLFLLFLPPMTLSTVYFQLDKIQRICIYAVIVSIFALCSLPFFVCPAFSSYYDFAFGYTLQRVSFQTGSFTALTSMALFVFLACWDVYRHTRT